MDKFIEKLKEAEREDKKLIVGIVITIAFIIASFYSKNPYLLAFTIGGFLFYLIEVEVSHLYKKISELDDKLLEKIITDKAARISNNKQKADEIKKSSLGNTE